MSPYATQEDSHSLWYEQSIFVSTHLASVGYGLHIAIFSIVTYYTLKQRHKSESGKAWIGWLVFNTFMFAMGTINLACNIRFNENAWVNDREYPGGPFAYLSEQESLPMLTLADVASILSSLLADALLLYRAALLWNGIWFIVIPPVLFFIACVIVAILAVIQIALPAQTSHWLPLGLALWIVLMILPIWASALIITRIWYQKRRVAKMIGKEEAKIYTSVSAIIIEAALPYTIISIILLGLFGDDNTAQNLFIPLLVQVGCIAPEMIILRVMLGRAWTRQSVVGNNPTTRSELKFAHPMMDSMLVATAQYNVDTPATRTNRVSLVSLEDISRSNQSSGEGKEKAMKLSSVEEAEVV